MRESFGQYIRKLRMEKEMTLTQLGAQLGIDSGALSKIENGKKRLDDKILPKLAKIFKLNLQEIRDEFYSEIIATEIIQSKCTNKILGLVEQKLKYIKGHYTKRSEITC